MGLNVLGYQPHLGMTLHFCYPACLCPRRIFPSLLGAHLDNFIAMQVQPLTTRRPIMGEFTYYSRVLTLSATEMLGVMYHAFRYGEAKRRAHDHDHPHRLTQLLG